MYTFSQTSQVVTFRGMAYKNHHYSVNLDLSGVELIERRTIGIGPGNGNKRKNNNKVIETACMEYWRSCRRISDQGIYFGSSISEVVLC